MYRCLRSNRRKKSKSSQRSLDLTYKKIYEQYQLYGATVDEKIGRVLDYPMFKNLLESCAVNKNKLNHYGRRTTKRKRSRSCSRAKSHFTGSFNWKAAHMSRFMPRMICEDHENEQKLQEQIGDATERKRRVPHSYSLLNDYLLHKKLEKEFNLCRKCNENQRFHQGLKFPSLSGDGFNKCGRVSKQQKRAKDYISYNKTHYKVKQLPVREIDVPQKPLEIDIKPKQSPNLLGSKPRPETSEIKTKKNFIQINKTHLDHHPKIIHQQERHRILDSKPIPETSEIKTNKNFIEINKTHLDHFPKTLHGQEHHKSKPETILKPMKSHIEHTQIPKQMHQEKTSVMPKLELKLTQASNNTIHLKVEPKYSLALETIPEEPPISPDNDLSLKPTNAEDSTVDKLKIQMSPTNLKPQFTLNNETLARNVAMQDAKPILKEESIESSVAPLKEDKPLIPISFSVPELEPLQQEIAPLATGSVHPSAVSLPKTVPEQPIVDVKPVPPITAPQIETSVVLDSKTEYIQPIVDLENEPKKAEPVPVDPSIKVESRQSIVFPPENTEPFEPKAEPTELAVEKPLKAEPEPVTLRIVRPVKAKPVQPSVALPLAGIQFQVKTEPLQPDEVPLSNVEPFETKPIIPSDVPVPPPLKTEPSVNPAQPPVKTEPSVVPVQPQLKTELRKPSVVPVQPPLKSEPRKPSVVPVQPALKTEPRKPSIVPVQPPLKTEPRKPSVVPVHPPLKTEQSLVPVQPSVKTEERKPSVVAVQPPLKTEQRKPSIVPVQPPLEQRKPSIVPVQPPLEQRKTSIVPVQPPLEQRKTSIVPVQPPLEQRKPSVVPVQPPLQTDLRKPSIAPVQPPLKTEPKKSSIIQPVKDKQMQQNVVSPLQPETTEPVQRNLIPPPNSKPVQPRSVPVLKSEPVQLPDIPTTKDEVQKTNVISAGIKLPKQTNEPPEALNTTPVPTIDQKEETPKPESPKPPQEAEITILKLPTPQAPQYMPTITKNVDIKQTDVMPNPLDPVVENLKHEIQDLEKYKKETEDLKKRIGELQNELNTKPKKDYTVDKMVNTDGEVYSSNQFSDSTAPDLMPVIYSKYDTRPSYSYDKGRVAAPKSFLQQEMEKRSDEIVLNGLGHLDIFANFLNEKYQMFRAGKLDETYIANILELRNQTYLMADQLKRHNNQLKLEQLFDRFKGINAILPIEPISNLFYVHVKEFMKRFPADIYYKYTPKNHQIKSLQSITEALAKQRKVAFFEFLNKNKKKGANKEK